MKKLDRRRKYYIVLDCETATLDFVNEFSGEVRKKIAIAKPLIYDLGWQIIDNKGRVYRRKNFLISEIFSVPSVFNTAYYLSKRPLYIEKLNNGEITLTDWNTAINELIADMEEVDAVGAYNSMFDFKKAIPFTECYIKKLYSDDFNEWREHQYKICKYIIAKGKKFDDERKFNKDLFRFRGKEYPLFDLWGLSVKHLLNNDKYKTACIENNWISHSGIYFSTTAENAFRFLTADADFTEAHTAIDDSIIESEIFAMVHKKTRGKWEKGIIYFPFRILGKVDEF